MDGNAATDFHSIWGPGPQSAAPAPVPVSPAPLYPALAMSPPPTMMMAAPQQQQQPQRRVIEVPLLPPVMQPQSAAAPNTRIGQILMDGVDTVAHRVRDVANKVSGITTFFIVIGVLIVLLLIVMIYFQVKTNSMVKQMFTLSP